MKSVVRSVLEPRPPSRPKTLESDMTRAFASIEEDILNIQGFIERYKIKNLDSGVYRGKLHSRRSLQHSSKSSQFSLETSMTLQNYRNSTLTEPIYNLIISTLGSQYSAIPSETVLRLSLLKIKLHEVLIRKIAEILAARLESEPENDGKVVGLLIRIIELNPEPKENDSRIKELEQTIADLRNDARKESKSGKESEEMALKFKTFEKIKNEELDAANKKIKELEIDKGRVSLLVGEMEKLRKKLMESEIHESRVNFLQSELEMNKSKLTELADSFEKSVRKSKKLEETLEKAKIHEKSVQGVIDGLTKEIMDLKSKLVNLDRQGQETKTKELQNLKQELEEKTQKMLDEKNKHLHQLSIEKENLENSIKSAEILSKSLINDLKSANSELTSELQKLKQDVEKTSSENSSIKVSLNLTTSELAELKIKLRRLEIETKEKTEKNEELALKVQELSGQLKEIGASQDTEKFLYSEIYKLRAELTQVSWKLDERLILCEKLESEIKNLKIDLGKSRSMNDRLQDELVKANSTLDDDTFENVMRNEMNIMRETFEKRIKDTRDEIDNMKRKHFADVKKVKDELKSAEHAREYLEIRLKSLNGM